MNARLLAGMALPVAGGFALGMATAPRGESSGGGRPTGGEPVPERRTVSALSGGSPGSAVMLSRVAAHPSAGGFSKLMAYMKLVRSAEVEEFPELIERIRREVAGVDLSYGDFLTANIVRRWAELDPVGAFEAVVAGLPPEMRDQAELVIPLVADSHPRETWAILRETELHGRRRSLKSQLLLSIADTHPGVAIELLADLNPSADRHLINSSLGQIAKERPAEAMAFAESLPRGPLGTGGALSIVIDGKHRVFEKLASGAADTTLAVARSWAQSNPAAAVAWAEAQQGSRRETALIETVAEWGKNEPEAALEYARSAMSEREQGSIFSRTLASEGLSIDRRRAVAETYGGELDDSYHYETFSKQWIAEDAAGLGAWLAERPGDGAEGLMLTAATHWAAHSPGKAAAGVVEIADTEMRRIAVEGVVKRFLAHTRLGLEGVPDVEMPPEVLAAFEKLRAERGGRMKGVPVVVGIALLAIAGFAAGRWVGAERAEALPAAAVPASPAPDPVEALLAESAPDSGGGAAG